MMVLLAILVVFLFFFVRVAYETVTCYWVIPRRIRRIMEKQGVCGPKPRFLTGNILDMASLVSKSTSKDMDSIHHDIVGRLLPHFLVWSKLYGNPFFFSNRNPCQFGIVFVFFHLLIFCKTKFLFP